MSSFFWLQWQCWDSLSLREALTGQPELPFYAALFLWPKHSKNLNYFSWNNSHVCKRSSQFTPTFDGAALASSLRQLFAAFSRVLGNLQLICLVKWQLVREGSQVHVPHWCFPLPLSNLRKYELLTAQAHRVSTHWNMRQKWLKWHPRWKLAHFPFGIAFCQHLLEIYRQKWYSQIVSIRKLIVQETGPWLGTSSASERLSCW